MAMLLASLPCWALPTPPARADELFDVSVIPASGRTVAADFADMDGDGRSDVVSAAVLGIPPEESRFLRVYFQGEDGSFSGTASRVLPLPVGAAAYDIADVLPDPGDELLLLRPDSVAILKVGRASQSQRVLAVPGATTMGAAQDERGLEELQLVRRGPDGSPRIWVPQLGEMSALTPTGEVVARIRTGGRANYFIPPRPGLIQNESDIQLFYDAARLSLGDVDGDGRQDAVTTTRHDLRIFLGREDGSLPNEADRQIPLRRMEFRDHIRGSGGVSAEVQDIDGDGRVDLLLSHVKGSLADATTRATIHMNRGGTFDLSDPDVELVSESTLVSNILLDVDGDGRLELLRMSIAFSILEVIETLMSQEIDVELAIHRSDGDAPFASKPWSRRKVEVGWSFDTFRPIGFIPTVFDDWNGDGYTDFFSSGDGDAIEVHLGGPRNRYLKRNGRQKLDTAGVVQTGDLDRDGLTDFVLHDPHTVDAPVRVGRNKGALPGSPPRLEAAEK
ncbi:MAG: FG-GAP repeat domain-containing protein [Myxococcota bacterium]